MSPLVSASDSSEDIENFKSKLPMSNFVSDDVDATTESPAKIDLNDNFDSKLSYKNTINEKQKLRYSSKVRFLQSLT